MMAVQWVEGFGSAPCMVCESADTALIACVRNSSVGDVYVERCRQCASLRLLGTDLDYSGDDITVDDYVEGGAGIDVIARVLARVPRDSVRRFLDVGCYYGFGVHVAERFFGWEAVGLEPSGAGERGRIELGVDIRSGLLDEVEALGTFDLVLASEVVEHVTDPIPFLAQIRQLLSSRGLLIMTTPSAESIGPQSRRENEMLQALSPGHHRYLASADGLGRLLVQAGFSRYHVVRKGPTLHAVAGDSQAALKSVAEASTLDQRAWTDYLDRAANAAPPGSALAVGMASRHFRAATMNADFSTAKKSFPRLREALDAFRGFNLDDPGSCHEELDRGRRAAWSLPGAAYSAGMLALLGQADPGRAASYFELAAKAAEAWGREAGVEDVDTSTIRELSLGHLCIALARHDPTLARNATSRLTEALDGSSPTDAQRIAWWKTRTLNELVAAGVLEVDPELLDEVESCAEDLAHAEDPEYRRVGLDALFLLGVRALNTGSPMTARQWFATCLRGCEALPNPGEHARRLAADAREHDAMAATRDWPYDRVAGERLATGCPTDGREGQGP